MIKVVGITNDEPLSSPFIVMLELFPTCFHGPVGLSSRERGLFVGLMSPREEVVEA